MTRKEFLADEKTRSAVAFKIENIGEASKNIPKEIRSQYKEIPWTEMARMRDKITHFYFGIDFKIVWSVIKKELPSLELAIAKVKKGFLILLAYPVHYEITTTTLEIRSGILLHYKIPLSSIKLVVPTRSPLSSPAWSLVTILKIKG